MPVLVLFCALLLGACATVGGLERANLSGRKDALPFSHVVTAGDFVFLAGTLGLDPKTSQAPSDPEAEARLMLDDLRAKLELVGLGMEDLVQVTVFCPDLTLYDLFNKVYAAYFRSGFPTRAFIGSGPLLRGCRFEIQGIAARR